MKDKLASALLLMFGLFVLALVFLVMVLRAKSNQALPAMVKFDMTNLVSCLASYHAIYGNFPTGNNAQITSALNGENPRKVMLNPIGPRRAARSKEILDFWDTAYRFSFQSNSVIVVCSAGKNGLFGDTDDVVVGVALADTNFPFMKLPPQLTNTPAQK